MNLPNRLTLIRLILVPGFVVALWIGGWIFNTLALAIFVAASITDYYDGKIARRKRLITNFGKLMDPVADKILVSAAFISFLKVDFLGLPAWPVIILVAREFFVTGIRAAGAAEGKIIPARFAGKAKMVFQVITICTALTVMVVRGILKDFELLGGAPLLQVEWWTSAGVYVLTLVTAVITLYTGLLYLRDHKSLLRFQPVTSGSHDR